MSKNKELKNQEAKANKNNKKDKGEIIVINEGKVSKSKSEEERSDVEMLGLSADDKDIVIDTKCLDEELGIAEIFEQSGVTVRPIGKSKEEKKKNQVKESIDEEVINVTIDEDEEEDKPELSKQVLDTFTMILKGKDYEPIPYPFQDNEMAFNVAFEQVLENVDHMTIAKFSRKYPELSLKDVFKQVFTVPDESDKDVDVELIKPLDVREDSEFKERVDKFIDDLNNLIIEKLQSVLMEVLKEEESEPEKVLQVLLEQSEKLSETNVGKLIMGITNHSIADIIRAEINGSSMDELKDILDESIGKLLNSETLVNAILDEDKSVNEIVDTIVTVLNPNIDNMSLTQILKNRKTIAPHMTDIEFVKFVVKSRIKKTKHSQEITSSETDNIDTNEQEDINIEISVEGDEVDPIKTASEKLYNVTKNAASLIDRLNASYTF